MIVGFVPILLISSLLFPLVSGYSFNIQSAPKQCENVTFAITGDGGQGPYSVLVVPFGPSSLSNNIEVRPIQEFSLGDDKTSVSFPLMYPENTQFVAVVSDATGFGTGGTSIATTVLSGGSSSCFDANRNVSHPFFFHVEPPNQIVQCSETRLWWDNPPANVQGVPSFLGVIPGGQSFAIPQGDISDVASQGTGFDWLPNIRAGTTVIIVASDDRGAGTGGSYFVTVSAGLNPTNDCLNDTSPSSTPNSPAGGVYPTQTTTSGVVAGTTSSISRPSSSGGRNNVGIIVGGIISASVVGILALLLALFLWRHRSRSQGSTKGQLVDLLQDDEDDVPQGELPQYYSPEPYMVRDTASHSSRGRHTSAAQTGRPLSSVTSTSHSGIPDTLGIGEPPTSDLSRKQSGMPRPLRPVNIIQHEDAVFSDTPKDEEPVTVELPPAYTNIKPQTPIL